MVEQSFHSVLLKSEIYNITPYNPEISSVRKDISKKIPFNPISKTPIRYNEPILVPTNSKKKTPGFTDHISKTNQNKTPNPDQTYTPTGDLKIKISRN